MFNIDHYISTMDEIDGWCSKLSAKIMYSLGMYQDVDGNILEIGIHHGKSFIPIFSSIKNDEFGVALDLFDKQELNKDIYGKGDKEKFLFNLEKFSLLNKNLKIIQDDSTIIKKEKLIINNKKYRMISIDGSHTEEATLSDLKLSDQLLYDNDGIVMLDDILNPHWLGVISGYCKFNFEFSNNLIPIAFVPNKLILSRNNSAEKYKKFLRQKFSSNISKSNVSLFEHKIDIYAYK